MTTHGKLMALAGAALLLGGSPAVRAAGCGCMDVALVVDDTGSMGGALNNVKTELPTIIATALAASGGDLRVGMVTFPNDNVVVDVPFTTDMTVVNTAIQALSAAAGSGAGEPESSDEALQYAVTGAADASCTVSNGTLGSFRQGCLRIAVVITDAHPGGCDDAYVVGVDDVHAHTVAATAADAGILVSAIYVPSFGVAADIKAIMQDYADTSGGVYVETAADGTGTGEGITDIIASCGSKGSQDCVTRNSRFWFTHVYATNSTGNCATLLNAIAINGGGMSLGFLRLPTTYRDADSSLTETDALIEAVSFYWKNSARTGESSGSQNETLAGSSLCRARKKLSIELIAATANVRLLGTKPNNCTYTVNGVLTNFPVDLLQQARQVASGSDPIACKSMTQLLQTFNQNGTSNNFSNGMVECSPNSKAELRRYSRDPTTQLNCPGPNYSCDTALGIFFHPKNQFARPSFSQTVNLMSFTMRSSSFGFLTNTLPGVTCASVTTTNAAFWKITPDVGVANREFTASTDGSNFDNVLSVYSGTCSNLTPVACAGSIIALGQTAQVSFSTDGTNTYYIVGQGVLGDGRLHFKITSP
jgi:hypothetical protein